MEGQMNIFDYQQYLPDEIKKCDQETKQNGYDIFHEHCVHRGWNKYDEEREEAIWMCGYANKQNARCWDDWIACTVENCPLLQGDAK